MTCATPVNVFRHITLIKRFQIVPVEHLFRASGNDMAVIEQHQDMVAEATCPAHIVEHHHERFTLPGQFTEYGHGTQLMAQIQMLQRFIQQIIFWRLGSNKAIRAR